MVEQAGSGQRSTWSRPVRVRLLGAGSTTRTVGVPTAPLSRAASVLSWLIPTALAVVGILVAVPSAVIAEREGSEAVGTFGLEAGAALWFAGAVTLGATRATTVRQVALLGVTGAAGAVLVAVALTAGLDGSLLALTMEFGVGAVAVVVIDVVLLGLLHSRVDWVARGMGRDLLVLDLSWRWPPVRMRRERNAGDEATAREGSRAAREQTLASPPATSTECQR